MILNKTHAEELLAGSLILGCGGGGNEAQGRRMFEAAFEIAEEQGNHIELISVEELMRRNADGVVVTISGVGSPSSPTAYTPPEYYPRLLELLEKQLDKKIIGFIACEIGGSSTFEPFVPAAMLGVPVIDAPCDGRAHPLGLMGSLGLEKLGEAVVQAGVGGKDKQYVEITVHSSLESASALIRNASSQAGGFLAVARNPVKAKWLEENGACGAYMQTLTLGREWNRMVSEGEPAEKMADVIAAILNGRIAGRGKIKNYICNTENALDNGSFEICDGTQSLILTFFNEYMTLENEERRIATFPDGIIILGDDCKAYSSAMLARYVKLCVEKGVEPDMEFSVIITDKKNLMIPTGVRYRNSYDTIEETVNKDMIEVLEGDGFFLD